MREVSNSKCKLCFIVRNNKLTFISLSEHTGVSEIKRGSYSHNTQK